MSFTCRAVIELAVVMTSMAGRNRAQLCKRRLGTDATVYADHREGTHRGQQIEALVDVCHGHAARGVHARLVAWVKHPRDDQRCLVLLLSRGQVWPRDARAAQPGKGRGEAQAVGLGAAAVAREVDLGTAPWQGARRRSIVAQICATDTRACRIAVATGRQLHAGDAQCASQKQGATA